MRINKNGVLILIALTFLSILLLYFNPSLTGLAVYEHQEIIQTWDLNNLDYNSDEIEFSDNSLKLKPQVEDNSYTETIENTAAVTSATKNGGDQTSKVTAIDNKKVTIYHNDIFLITFDHELTNKNIINLNLEGNQETTISLCNELGESCYVSLNYPGSSGSYILTIQNLPEAITSFKLNVSNNNVKFNYISATYQTEIFHSIINTSYPSSSSIQTGDLEISNLDTYGILTKEETLNEQTINYYYSTGSGSTWNQITDFNLSSITENPIKFKITLNSDTINTPTLNSLSLNYFTKTCTEDWTCDEWSPEICPQTETQTRTCIDNNECETTNNKPEESKTCEYSCEENWQCSDWGLCSLNSIQSRTCSDLNNCKENKIETQNCINYQTKYEITTSELVSIKQNTLTEISTDKTKLEILLNNNVINNKISIIDYNSSNLSLPEKLSAKRFVDITAENGLVNSLQNYILKIYYTSNDIQGLNEDSLKISHFNEVSGAWEELESYVNTTENYVWVNLTHFSTYGIFGDQISQQTQSSSSSGGGFSGGSSSKSKAEGSIVPPKIKEPEEQTEAYASEEETIQKLEKEETIQEEIQKKTFMNFMTGQTTLIKNKITEFAKGNIYLIISIFALILTYLIIRSISFFKVKKEKKLIIFDFDGVIADTLDKSYEGFKYISKKYGFKELKNKDEFRNLYKQNILKSLKGLNINYKDLLKIKNEVIDIANKQIEEIKIFPGIKDLIKKLKGYNLAIVSSNEGSIIKKFLEKNEIDYFNLILDYKTFNKKRKLRKAIKYFKIITKEAVFVTDTVGDIKEAKKLRLDTIAVIWGYNKKEDFKDLKIRIVNKPDEILGNI